MFQDYQALEGLSTQQLDYQLNQAQVRLSYFEKQYKHYETTFKELEERLSHIKAVNPSNLTTYIRAIDLAEELQKLSNDSIQITVSINEPVYDSPRKRTRVTYDEVVEQFNKEIEDAKKYGSKAYQDYKSAQSRVKAIEDFIKSSNKNNPFK